MAQEYRCVKCNAFYEQSGLLYCSSCSSFSTIVPAYRRAISSLVSKPCAVVGADVLCQKSAFEQKVEGISWGKLNMLYGPPGGGKSTFALKICASFFGTRLFFSLEEGLSETVSKKLQFLEIRDPNILICCPTGVEEMVSLIDDHSPSLVVVDSVSVSTLKAEDLVMMATDKTKILAVLQVNKSGQAQGKMDLPHVADVVIRVDDLKWKIEKSRYQGVCDGAVLSA